MNKQNRRMSGGVKATKNSVLKGGVGENYYCPIKNSAAGKPVNKGQSGPTKVKGGIGIK